MTINAIKDMKTVMYAGVLPVLLCSGVSASQVCSAYTKETHPIILLRVNIAAIGMVVDMAPVISDSFLGFGGST